MLDSLHQFLYNARFFVLLVTVPVGLYSAWRCFAALTAPTTAPTRRVPARPPGAPPKQPSAGQPVQQNLLTPPASVEAGKESHINKAVASTVRIDSSDLRRTSGSDAAVIDKPTAVADEVDRLFAGLDDQLKPATTPEERTAEALAKAGRLEQLGFHRPTQTDANAVRPASNPGKPTEAANGPELDDILAKLDKVLSDKPAAPSPAATKAPLWARADATDEEVEPKPDAGKQLGLFDGNKDKPVT